MPTSVLRSITALLLLALPACARENPSSLRDTTGATFALVCDESGCHLAPEGATPPPATCNDDSVWYSYIVGRFVEICSVHSPDGIDGWATDASLCRPVVCDHDDECPLLLGRDYACHSGLCQLDDRLDELSHREVVQLCFDATPRPEDCHAQTQDPEVHAVFDLARESCPDDDVCSVPASCRRP